MIAHLGLQRRPRPLDHIRRVRDDRVEHVAHAVQQIAVREDDAIAHPMACGVAGRHLERGARDVGGADEDRRPLVRDGHRDAAAAGADIGNPQRHRAIRKQLLHRFDNQLGRRTRNQHVGRHLELEPPELTDADDVGQRFAGHAPRNERVVSRCESFGHRFTRVDEKALRRPTEDMLGEQPRVQIRLGRRNAGLAQPLPRRRDMGMNGHETAVASLSFSDW